jgi:hypothetical protein
VLVDAAQRTATRVEPSGHIEVVSEPGALELLPGLELALADVFSVPEP